MARGRCPYVTCRSVKYTNHRRVRRPRRPLRWMTDNVFTTRKRSQSTVGEGFHALPAWNEGQRRFARLKWCAGCARGICIRWAVDGGGRAVGDTGATRQALTGASNAARQSRKHGASRTPPLTGGCETNVAAYNAADAITSRPPMVRGLCPRDCIRGAVDTRRVHRGWRGCNRSRRTVAANAPRRSLDRGAPRTVRPTGGSVTRLAAYNATGVINCTSRLR